MREIRHKRNKFIWKENESIIIITEINKSEEFLAKVIPVTYNNEIDITRIIGRFLLTLILN